MSSAMVASTSSMPDTPHHPQHRVRKPSSSRATTATTLKTLYNRAATAFVQRDVSLTQSLLDSALSLLKPPPSFDQNQRDELDELRKKWDILRVTLVATVYSNPPSATSVTLPENLSSYLPETPSTVSTRLFNESLKLFTPSTAGAGSNAALIPAPVLTAHIYSCLKLDAPSVGRIIIEDWLAKRDFVDDGANLEEYEKMLELYILQVLPRLQEWDYAKEFLEYEMQLEPASRQRLRQALHDLHEQSQKPPPQTQLSSFLNEASAPSTRSSSPAPSSSSSSSLSTTTSNKTIVPSTPRPFSQTVSSLQNSSTSRNATRTASRAASTASNDTVRQSSGLEHGASKRRRSKSKERAHWAPPGVNGVTTNGHLSPSLGSPVAPIQQPLTSRRSATPTTTTWRSIITLIKQYLQPYLSPTNVTTFILLFVVLPALSLAFKLRRRQRLLGGGEGGGAVEVAKRRLLDQRNRLGLGGNVVGEFVRGVIDFVRMGQSGLV